MSIPENGTPEDEDTTRTTEVPPLPDDAADTDQFPPIPGEPPAATPPPYVPPVQGGPGYGGYVPGGGPVPPGQASGARGGLWLAVSLLTIVPVRVDKADRETAGAAMALAPWAGLIVGGVAALVLYLCDQAGLGALLAAGLAVAVMALLTRGLHLDGLADLADGLGTGRPAQQALDVMKKSDIGPFGVMTLVFTVLVQVAALAQAQGSGHGPLAVLVAAAAGRLALPWACRTGIPAARPKGLGALVAGTVRQGAAALTTLGVLVFAALAGLLATGWRGTVVGPLAVAAALVVALGLLRHALRRLGGITGDVLGALVETGTAAALIVLALL